MDKLFMISRDDYWTLEDLDTEVIEGEGYACWYIGESDLSNVQRITDLKIKSETFDGGYDSCHIAFEATFKVKEEK